MPRNQLKTTLTYLKEVLGVEVFAPAVESQIIAKSNDVSSPEAVKIEPQPYIFVSLHGASDSSLQEMQRRMVGALKLKINDFEFVNLDRTNVQKSWFDFSKVVVVFGLNTLAKLPHDLAQIKPGEVHQVNSCKVLLTHSLSDLAQSTSLKKETWAHLQSVF